MGERGTPLRILGIEAGNKESAAALVVDGRLVAAIREERLSRERRDDAVPRRAVRRLLEAHGLTLDAIDRVVGNLGERALRAAMGEPARKRPSTPLPAPPDGPEAHGYHHLAHASLGFWTSPFERALVVTIDDHGDADTLVAFRADRSSGLERVFSVPWRELAIGGAYQEATAVLGFGAGGEGKLMGLAAWAEPDPRWRDVVLHRDADGRLRSPLQAGALDDPAHPLAAELTALRRAPWAPLDMTLHARFAASTQAAFETSLLPLLRELLQTHGERHLVLGGGVALNCALAGRLWREPWLDGLWVGPDPADPGNAAGAALFASHRLGRTPPPDALLDGGLGVVWGPDAIRDALAALPAGAARVEEFAGDAADPRVAAAIADDLCAGRLLGIFSGPSEFGPRALGHRSITGDPRDPRLAERLNEAKLREPWRPVAPSILAERTTDWLRRPAPSPFMLMAFEATATCRERAPAAVHVDGTVRAQTVSPTQAPWYRAIAAFAERTGVPMVLNSSFNQAGEPIVEHPRDALDCARRAGLDVVWLEGVRVALGNPGVVVDPRPARPAVALDGGGDDALAPGWLRVLCDQGAVRVAAAKGLALRPPERASLGLAASDPVGPSRWPTLQLGPLLTRGRAADAPLAFAMHPPSRSDLGERQPPHVLPLAAATEGFAALRRAVRVGALGALQRIEVQVPAGAGPLMPTEAHGDAVLAATLRLWEGLWLAETLAGRRFDDLAMHGQLAAPTLVDGVGALRVRCEGGGLLPALRCVGADGEARLAASGVLHLQIGARTRSVGTSRGPQPWFRQVAATLAGAAWPEDDARAVETLDRVEAAVARWARGAWQRPGALGAQARADAATGGGAVDWQTPAEAPGRALAHAVGLVGRALAVQAGVRPAASWENVGPEQRAACEAVAAALGLEVAVLDAYEHALPARVEGAGTRVSLAIARDAALLEPLRREHAALLAATDDARRAAAMDALGVGYGVPACCRRAFVRMQRFDLAASFTHVFCDARVGPALPLVNPRLPGRWIEHFPCSLACAASEALAERSLLACVAEPDRLAALAALPALPPEITEPLAALAQRWADAPDEADVDALIGLHAAPLLYVDPTRYAVGAGAVATEDAGGWRLEGGRWIGSGAWIGRLPADEERRLQADFAASFVAPLAAAASRGSLRVEIASPDERGAGVASVRGAGWAWEGSGRALRLQPGVDAATRAALVRALWARRQQPRR